MQRERDIEKKLKAEIEGMGGMACKFTSPGNDGVPDRVVILPVGLTIFVELKTDHGRLSPVQVWQQTRMRRAGARVITVYGVQGVEDFIQALRAGSDELLAVYGKEGGSGCNTDANGAARASSDTRAR